MRYEGFFGSTMSLMGDVESLMGGVDMMSYISVKSIATFRSGVSVNAGIVAGDAISISSLSHLNSSLSVSIADSLPVSAAHFLFVDSLLRIQF